MSVWIVMESVCGVCSQRVELVVEVNGCVCGCVTTISGRIHAGCWV